MLGDAIVYGFSLYVVGRGLVWQARGALLTDRLGLARHHRWHGDRHDARRTRIERHPLGEALPSVRA
jgi:hypothetical protein